MTWSVACFCGHVFDCVPPALCPSCGELVEDPADRDWYERMRDEVGLTTDQDAADTGAAW